MLFSQRYFRAIENNVLVVDIPDAARRKLWAWLSANNASLGIQRNPNDSWISSSSVLEETERELLIEHGWDHLPVSPHSTKTEYHAALHLLVLDGPGPFIFDTIEIAANNMDAGERDSLRQKVNQIFELHDCPWRISDGQFFKLDADFVGAKLGATAHEGLTANQFAGAANEYAKARQYLGTGDVREAIFFAGHSFESVMKVLTKLEHANGDKLSLIESASSNSEAASRSAPRIEPPACLRTFNPMTPRSRGTADGVAAKPLRRSHGRAPFREVNAVNDALV
jgi:hypothetical protein